MLHLTRQRFLDPLYGPIVLDEKALALAFSPDFQRLRYVRLCNINSLFLTGASEPKRFEHCLGVYHLADVWTIGRNLTERQKNVVRSAALLHDILTGPFGHSFQYVMEDNPFDTRFEHTNLAGGVSKQFLQLTRAGAQFAGRSFEIGTLLGDLAGEVFEAIRGEGEFGPIISGTLDLDNVDNVVRLAFHMGLTNDEDRSLPARLAPMLNVSDGLLAVPAAAEPLLQRWFDIRRLMYEYLLLDRGEFSAKAMLTRAVELAAQNGLLEPSDWRLTDEELMEALHRRSTGDQQSIGRIVNRLRVGDLFECLGVWSTDETELYGDLSSADSKRKLESRLDQELAGVGGTRLRTCLHYILDDRKTCRSISFRNLDTERGKIVGHDSKSLLVGAFVTNSRAGGISPGEQRRAAAIVKDMLEASGLPELTPAAELLGHAPEAQGFLL